MYMRRITDEALAQYAYLIGCQRTGEAIVVDPERDIDRYLELAAAEGFRIVAAAETHIHADFLSGAREFADQHGVRLYLSDEGGDEWRSHWAVNSEYDVCLLHDGDTFAIGNIDFTVLHCPGHTPEHVAFVVTDRGGAADEPMGILSGDFVFVGDLGRPDLLESAAGVADAMRPAAEHLHQSAEGFFDFPDFMQVWPAHGAGSACGKALGAVPASTVGYEKRFSPALAAVRRGREDFVNFILADQPEPPLYFGRMKVLNRDGVPVLGELPRPERVEVGALADGDAVVLDTRPDREAFMAGHVPGAICAPLDKSFPTIAGSYVLPDEQGVYLVVEPEQLEVAVRQLIRIGIDDVRGYVAPADLAHAELISIPRIDFAGASETDGTVLDVRRAAEFSGSHVDGAVNIAHTRLVPRFSEVPTAGRVLVHCATGRRAAAAASYLARRGVDVVYVDDTYVPGVMTAAAPAEQGA
jgi:hydroxyacylglutathione hydrolase